MSAQWSAWPAPAKLNLFLHITGRRADGYHELQTVFRLLDWGDTVRLRPRADGRIVRLGGAAGVAEADDLTVRAAQRLAAWIGPVPGVDIVVEKRIPQGGGLGGGSSDAATVLVALNRLWDAGLGEDALAALGLQLGADVPLFVRGRSAWADGVGEQLVALDLGPAWYVLLDTHCAVPTGPLFAAPELTRDAAKETIPRFLSGLVSGNAFERPVRARYPRVAQALDWLGASARLSGSGGTVFLETVDRDSAMAIAARCPQDFTAVVAAGVDESPLITAVAQFAAGASPSW
ncbi:MAG TPA: 4-(cytidine 5'-diphospho)-2-C-methyl-D-erythritol kinase [Rhodanobacteraceae bacterium]|nr:4-(cytidine 5'-diphospho)-2-C-methyl-D-erythritol kinase [Rhodanobacteraceae bacterium]